MRIPLTPRQRSILDMITEHLKKNGSPPTRREVAAHFEIAVATAHKSIERLAKKGYLRILKGERRGILVREDLLERKS